MALGLDRAGFAHAGLVERDLNAVQTLRANAESGVGLGFGSEIEPTDIHQVRYNTKGVTLLAAGVPCQPFSLAGNHKGGLDDRNLFPEVFRAQRALEPSVVLLENVWGLARPNFRQYLEYILLQLALPSLPPKGREAWMRHKDRLKASLTKERRGITYDVWISAMECANFGVPQRRNRLFIVAFRTDLDIAWKWPMATHSEAGLLYAKYYSKTYWADHEITPTRTPQAERQEMMLATAPLRRWRTVRDAIGKLPAPALNGNGGHHANHYSIEGARSYRGHTGSVWDEPSKTLKAGVHGVPGGENMLLLADGSVRYFTVHEAAILQTFPKQYVFCGTRSAMIRQIGNAAPMRVVEVLGKRILRLSQEAREGTCRVPHVDLIDGAKLRHL
jgi:DNA (cytosine-5)-methyltransferase 1